MNNTDKLTSLTSGTELNAKMETFIANENKFALIWADIDELFVINRDYGKDAGDDVIRLIAKHIKNLFPEPCLSFRMGEEFGILIPNVGKEKAFLKAEELRKLICDEKLKYTSADTPMKQSVSVGIASYPDDGSRAADILRRADSAMHRAKKEGRNAVYLAKEEKLIPKSSHYTQVQLEKLSLISEKIGVGEAALLREALDDLIRKYPLR